MAIEKRFTHRIDIRATDVRLIGSVVQYDHFSNVVVCRLVDGIDEVDISGADFVTVTYKLNGNYLCMDALGARVNITSYEGGEITIILPDGAIRAPGDVYATVEVYEDETRMTSGKFAFRVVPDMSVDHGDNVELEDGFPILQEIATAESLRVQAETIRVSHEGDRQTAETARARAETDRRTAESGRVTAEAGRVTAENARVSAEERRASTITTLQTGLATVTSKVNNDIYTKTETDAQIDAKVTEIGAGDMTKAVYDTDNDGVVDNSEERAHASTADLRANASKLGNQLPSYYATASDLDAVEASLSDYALDTDLAGYVPISRTVNGHNLSDNVTITRDNISGIVKSNTTSSKTLNMTLNDGVLTITYQ